MNNMLVKLANKNNQTEEVYVKLVQEKVREIYTDEADEIAILRKEIAILRTIIEQNLQVTLPASEFVSYNENIEKIKQEEKEEVYNYEGQ